MRPLRARRRRTLRAFAAAWIALWAFTAAAGVSHAADEPAQRAQSVVDALRAGDVASAVERLGDPAGSDGIAARSDLVHVLCDRAYRYDRPTTDTAARRALASRLLALATDAAGRAPDDDRARWALSEALVLHERAGPRTGPAAWTRAADLLKQVHAKKPGDGLPLAYAVGFLLEGAAAEPEAAVPLADRAEALARAALDGQRDAPTLAVSIATSQFWGARTLLAANRKVAKDVLRATFESLRRFACKGKPVLEAATIWNDAVSFGRRSGFVLPEKFACAERVTLDGALRLDVPVSSRWRFETVAAADEQPSYDYLTESDSAGRRLRQILFRRFAWGRTYTFESSNPVGGDNVKSIAQGLQAMFVARVLAPGATAPSPSRKPFNRSMDGFVFETRGRAATESGEPGEPLRIQGCVMRGHSQACYAALVYDFTQDEEPSPEIEAILASLREPDE